MTVGSTVWLIKLVSLHFGFLFTACSHVRFSVASSACLSFISAKEREKGGRRRNRKRESKRRKRERERKRRKEKERKQKEKGKGAGKEKEKEKKTGKEKRKRQAKNKRKKYASEWWKQELSPRLRGYEGSLLSFRPRALLKLGRGALKDRSHGKRQVRPRKTRQVPLFWVCDLGCPFPFCFFLFRFPVFPSFSCILLFW